jgi:hypothetical protein
MTFPFLIHGEIKAVAAGQAGRQPTVQRLAEAVKREGGSAISISGDTLEFAGVTGQLSLSPLVNIERSTVTLSFEPDFLCVRYVARPERWLALVAVIVMVVGIIAWLLSIFPLQFPTGAGLAMLILWVAYLPILRLRYESFLKRSINSLIADAHRIG